MKGNLRSGGLAKATGLSPDTIRHYERIGVLPRAARTESGYRVYPPSSVERVRVIQRALRVGFSLSELAEVLKARDSGGAPCHRVYQLAETKLKGIAEEIQALEITERDLKKVWWDRKQRLHQMELGQRSDLPPTARCLYAKAET